MAKAERIAPADFTCVLYEVRDHVAIVTINRPERRNALNRRAYDEAEAAFRAASADPDMRCVVVTGADPAFCSGEDVKETMTGEQHDKSVARLTAVRPEPTPAAVAVLECDRPAIAAVNGAAGGWGMEPTLFADMRIASEQAKFGEIFIKRGLISDVGGLWRLPAIVGPARTAKLLFTGGVIDAGEALRYMKDGLRRTSYGDLREIGSWVSATLGRLFETEDHREAARSFLEKRAPEFKGR